MLKRLGLFLLAGVMIAGIGVQSVPASAHARNNTYAALGDSVAAGVGLPAADTDTRCGRSIQAYPYYVAQARNLTLVHTACSGATVANLFTSQAATGPVIPPQLDTAFVGGTPRLISITAGANDMRWADFLRKCAAATCGSPEDTAAADSLRAALAVNLGYAFSEIQKRSNGRPPTVVITGYSNPVSNACIGRQSIADADEIAWLNMERDQLNQTIRDSAFIFPFVKYASMNFTGHSMCSSQTWFQGLSDPNPFHPNAQGQAALATSVLEALEQ